MNLHYEATILFLKLPFPLLTTVRTALWPKGTESAVNLRKPDTSTDVAGEDSLLPWAVQTGYIWTSG